MKIQTGQQAPDFSLYDSGKKLVKLGENRDVNILLLFFPLAFTSVCTAELCSIRDNIVLYNNVHARVFGISVDSLYTLAKFKEEQGLNFQLLSDFNKSVSTAFGVLYDEFSFGMKGVSKRSSFVIDRDGIVQYAAVLENAGELPDFAAIQAVLAKIA
jgi:glutaredoxin-dependent peroxiredoxin